jgi:hypothetical protein
MEIGIPQPVPQPGAETGTVTGYGDDGNGQITLAISRRILLSESGSTVWSLT